MKRLHRRWKTWRVLLKIKAAGFEVAHKNDTGDGAQDYDRLFIKKRSREVPASSFDKIYKRILSVSQSVINSGETKTKK